MTKYSMDEKVGVTVDGIDMSCFTKEVEVTIEFDDNEANTFCGQDTIPGLDKSEITATFIQDFASGAVEATLRPLVVNKSTFPVAVIVDRDSAPAEDNPEFSATARLLSYTPLSGGLGDTVEIDVKFKLIGSIAVDDGS
jgi:hypothetical protein